MEQERDPRRLGELAQLYRDVHALPPTVSPGLAVAPAPKATAPVPPGSGRMPAILQAQDQAEADLEALRQRMRAEKDPLKLGRLAQLAIQLQRQ
jgi:hypothetical protein